MKHNVLIAVAALIISFGTAQTTLAQTYKDAIVVNKADGTQAQYDLAKSPIITFSKSSESQEYKDQIDVVIDNTVDESFLLAYLESLSFDYLMDSDGITSILPSTTRNDGAIYDIAGRRVTSPTRGNIYIINGKKIIYL